MVDLSIFHSSVTVYQRVLSGNQTWLENPPIDSLHRHKGQTTQSWWANHGSSFRESLSIYIYTHKLFCIYVCICLLIAQILKTYIYPFTFNAFKSPCHFPQNDSSFRFWQFFRSHGNQSQTFEQLNTPLLICDFGRLSIYLIRWG